MRCEKCCWITMLVSLPVSWACDDWTRCSFSMMKWCSESLSNSSLRSPRKEFKGKKKWHTQTAFYNANDAMSPALTGLHLIAVNIVTHFLLHCFAFHPYNGQTNSFRMKRAFFDLVNLLLQLDHIKTLFIKAHCHFSAFLLRIVLFHLFHPQFALHYLFALGCGFVHHLQMTNWPFFLHHLFSHLHFTFILEPGSKMIN